jgi:hypothetical protein
MWMTLSLWSCEFYCGRDMGALISIGSGTGPRIGGGKILPRPSLVLVLNDVCSLSHPPIGPMLSEALLVSSRCLFNDCSIQLHHRFYYWMNHMPGSSMLGGCLYPGLFVCLTRPENLQGGWFLEDGTNKAWFLYTPGSWGSTYFLSESLAFFQEEMHCGRDWLGLCFLSSKRQITIFDIVDPIWTAVFWYRL